MKNTSNGKLKLAINLYQQNNFKNALKILSEFNKNNLHRNSISLQLEAVCYAKEGNYLAAANIIEQAINLAKKPEEKSQALKIANEVDFALKNINGLKVQKKSYGLSSKPTDITILGDNKAAFELTKKLIELLMSMGAKFDKALSFVEKEGNLSIISSRKINQVHMQVPICCMPLLTDYDLSITENEQLKAEVKPNPLNPAAIPVMELMVELFNITNKIAEWKKVFPFLVLDYAPDIINELFVFRPQTRKLDRFLSYYQKKNWNKLLIESFIGSREFTYQRQHLLNANIQTVNSSEKGLLAIIDFLNHGMGDGGYVINSSLSCMDIVGTPNDKSNELCVQYGVLDPFLTFFIYGFVDTSSPFIYSGKCEIELLSGLKFCVLSMSGGIKRAAPLPAKLHYLDFYLPPGIKRQEEVVIVSDLIIPTIDKRSLFIEAIRHILLSTDTNGKYTNGNFLIKECKHIITQLAVINTLFWSKQKSIYNNMVSDSDNHVFVDFILLCEHSIRHLEPFTDKDEMLLK